MKTEPHKYTYDAPILRQETEMGYHYLPVPDSICSELLKSGHKRVLVTINGATIRRAVQSSKKSPCIVIGKSKLTDLGVEPGDMVEVEVWSDPDSDFVEIGEELAEVLRQDKVASERFFGMMTGQQRSLAYYVTSAKRAETRIKRALEIARKLRTHTLHSDR